MTPNSSPRSSGARLKYLPWALGVIIACRILLLVFAPHQDPSEARYAEISRKMVQTGNWVTPQHSYGVPFWAKPPLSMWMSALGMEVFGVNEFGSRIVIFLAALAVLWLVGNFARREWGPEAGYAAALMLIAMPLFFYCSAAVMTDLALAAGTTLTMISFRRAVTGGGSRGWGYAFFLGLAIGLLAKGPLTLVIAAPPIACWLLMRREWLRVWKSIPWISGTLLMLAIAAPWYVLAEQRTPGFIDYFIVGEHWHRFVTKGWKGDLYGNAHAITPGAIWLFMLLGTFPWCLGFLAAPFRQWRGFGKWAMADDGLGLYLILWALWPLLFFTPARNIIATYPLPALPAIALLLAALFAGHLKNPTARKFHPLHPAVIGASFALVAFTLAITLFFPARSPKHSERDLVRSYRDHAMPGDKLLYYGKRQYSAEFYTAGRALNTRSLATLEKHLNQPSTLYLAISARGFRKLPLSLREQFRPLGSETTEALLFQEIPHENPALSPTS